MAGAFIGFPTVLTVAAPYLEGGLIVVGAVVVAAAINALCVGWVYMETWS